MQAKPNSSLKARAIMWLAQREHSRSELRDKLLHHARMAAQTQAQTQAGAAGDPTAPADEPEADPSSELESRIDALLEWLEAHHYLSQARFVESRVHTRAERYGNVRIRMELARHGVALTPDTAQSLKQSELARAQAVWARKFGIPPADAATRAKQMRFLAGRGFSADVIHRVLKGGDTD